MSETQAWGWALVHFLWQGALVAGVLALMLRAGRRWSASARYAVALGALLAMAALPVLTAWQLDGSGAGGPSARAERPATRSGGVRPEPAAPEGAPGAAPYATAPAVAGERAATRPERAGQGGGGWARAAAVAIRAGDRARAAVDPFLPGVVAAWFLGVLLLSARLAGAWLRLRRLAAARASEASAACRTTLARVAARLRVTRPVRLLESAAVRAPAVVGWLRPVVLVPASVAAGLTPRQLELLLAHELAHVRRHDYAVNLLQSVIETVYFYHPAVWWVSGRVREEREHCCDDLAVRACGDRRLWAETLLRLEELRQEPPALAAAAAGGSLLRRVRRLLLPGTPAEMQPRWLAGALAVAAAVVLAAGPPLPSLGAADAGVADAGAVDASVSGADRVLSLPEARSGTYHTPASAAHALDTVIFAPATGDLESRWRWALETADDADMDDYSVGWTVGPNPALDAYVWFDRETPAFGTHGTLYGHITFSDLEGSTFEGEPLGPLVGERPARDIAVLTGMTRDGGRAELARLHASSFAIPVRLDDRALLWLGHVDGLESLTRLRGLYEGAASEELRRDVVAIAGVQEGGRAVTEALVDWLESDAPEGVREEAVEALGRQADPLALATLARTARDDRSSRIRAEAAESTGKVPLPQATDTLIRLARGLGDRDARREAIEGLSEREDPRALEALESIAREDPDRDLQREAVETIGEFRSERSVALLEAVIRDHSSADVQREAVESLAEAAPPADALPALERIARTHPSADVQREAVDALGELEREAGAAGPLARLMRGHPDPDVRAEAVGAYAEAVSPREAAPVLGRLAGEDRSEQVREEALDALSELAEPGFEELASIARSHPDTKLRVRAIEALGDSEDPRAEALLEELLSRP